VDHPVQHFHEFIHEFLSNRNSVAQTNIIFSHPVILTDYLTFIFSVINAEFVNISVVACLFPHSHSIHWQNKLHRKWVTVFVLKRVKLELIIHFNLKYTPTNRF
jgi:hypothetical protein